MGAKKSVVKILGGKVRNPTVFKINFNEPWYALIFKQKGLFFPIFLMGIVMQVFTTMVPFLIALVFESKSLHICFFVFGGWLLLEVAQLAIRRINPKFQLQCIYSIYESAHTHLLTVDPKYHVHRSSGAMLGKIDRAARGYEDFLDYINDDVIPLFVGLITVVVILFQYSYSLAAIVSLIAALIIIGGYYFVRVACQPWEKEFIRSDDAFKTTAVENLAQVQLIRSVFGTDYRLAKMQDHIFANIQTEGALWLSYTSVFGILSLLYFVSLVLLGLFLLKEVQSNSMLIPSAIGLFLSYMQGTNSLIKSARIFRKMMRSLASIKDLFAFIPSFGKQEIPVLYSKFDVDHLKADQIEIKARNIHFDYGGPSLFNGHSFELSIPRVQSNKLYGIIGPSGVGKSTFLSILGAQLKPLHGTIQINQIDIYGIGDVERRALIALQGQLSTNIQGTIRSNLLLGLPPSHSYQDQDFFKIIEDVGLKGVLNAHQGLETKIGEGGLNLSQGQRQRLNFAGLFLRASYYKPDLILIDEPTSSLDEISEAKITAMLIKLASFAVTFVIAHRLKTVKTAHALIDLSLLSTSSTITAISSEELLKVSRYYELLSQGNILLDN